MNPANTIMADQLGAQISAEATLISAVMRNRSILVSLGQVVSDQFIDPVHKLAWATLINDPLITEVMGLRIMVPSMTDQHANRIELARFAEPIIIRARDYVVNGHRRRSVRALLQRSLEEIDKHDQPIDTILGQLTRDSNQLTASSSRSRSAADVAKSLFEKGNTPPIPTGIPPLDYVLHGGLYRSSLTAGFARFKHGKTLLSATISRNLEARAIPTLGITLERRAGDLERFNMARALGIDAQDLDLENPQFQAAYDEYLDTTNRSLHYLHAPGITADALRAEIIADKYARDTQVAIIDYWQLINFVGNGREGREERMAISAQMLAELAVQLDMAFLIFGQLNDEGKPKYAEAILGSCGIGFRFTRMTELNPNAPDQGANCFIEGMVCNRGPVRSKGNPNAPSMQLVQPGPHFREYSPS